MLDGLNSQLSDIDFYDAVRLAVKSSGSLSYDVTLPAYFRKNPFMSMLSDYGSDVHKSLLSVLEQILTQMEMKMNFKSALAPMLDSVKNSLIGKVHYPHPYFIEKGCHSITLVTHGQDLKDNMNSKSVAMLWTLEKLMRIHDQLDE